MAVKVYKERVACLCIFLTCFLFFLIIIIDKKIEANVIFLIFSKFDNLHVRNILRKTWIGKLPSDSIVLFAIGINDLNDENFSILQEENNEHGDLIFLGIKDDYDSLTEKLLYSFSYIDKNFNFKFLFKGDDDTYIKVDDFLYELNTFKPKRFYWGYFVGNARVKSIGKWKENEWFLCDRYLPYARGGGYVLSNDLVSFIASNINILSKYKSEDVSLGVWLSPLDIVRKHDLKFNTEFTSRGCSNKHLVFHKVSPQKMFEYKKNEMEKGKICFPETKLKSSYEYNWNVLPSLCCIKNNQ